MWATTASPSLQWSILSAPLHTQIMVSSKTLQNTYRPASALTIQHNIRTSICMSTEQTYLSFSKLFLLDSEPFRFPQWMSVELNLCHAGSVYPSHIKLLDLSHNNISRIEAGFFRPSEKLLSALYLGSNKLTVRRKITLSVFGEKA